MRKKLKTEEENEPPLDILIKNIVTPLWNVPYEEQLEKKEKELKQFLVKYGRQIEKLNPSLKSWLQVQRQQNSFQCCPLLSVERSPVTTGYRNKCEFTVGPRKDTGKTTVGFRVSQYQKGSFSVVEPDGCFLVPEPMMKAVQSFQSYLDQSEKSFYNPETYQGYWRQLTVRSTRNNEVMLIIIMHPQELTQDEIDSEKNKLLEFFKEENKKENLFTSVYFVTSKQKQADGEGETMHLILGQEHISETILDCTFNISPKAFFQVNSWATEKLYSKIMELAELTPQTVLLDICCGTGTIGLLMAKKCKQVVGVEICEQAIINARKNAEINGIKNSEFIKGKAEDYIYDILPKGSNEEYVAVLDPPRAGIHSKVIRAIRGSENLKTLIYVACNPNGALSNLTDLCRPMSKNYRGSPFLPVKSVAVDLFPHTSHCELAILLKRK